MSRAWLGLMKQLLDTVETAHISIEEVDRLILQTAVARGYLSQEHADAVADEKKRRTDAGRVPSVGQILLEQKRLNETQLDEVLKEVQRQLDEKVPSRETARVSADVAPITLGRYQVLREIARGGMAVVYEAFDPDLKRSVALKVLREESSSALLVLRLQREGAALAKLNHPNIVSVYEIGETADALGAKRYFIAMHYVRGKTLAEWMPALSQDERLEILETVAVAVGHAHSQGIVHRDLKPQNVLLEEGPSGTRRVYVTDFGLAKVEGDEDMTRTGTVLGTAYYMAPEQARGLVHDTGPWTDVWALGAMLYEMITDHRPFVGETALQIYENISRADPTPPHKIHPAVSADIETVCLKALQKETSNRYRDAAQFARELNRCRTHQPVRGRLEKPEVSFGAWLRGHPMVTGLALGAMAMLLVALMFSLEEKDPAGESRSMLVSGLLIGAAVLALLAAAVGILQYMKDSPDKTTSSGGHASRSRMKKRSIHDIDHAAKDASEIINRWEAQGGKVNPEERKSIFKAFMKSNSPPPGESDRPKPDQKP